MAPLRNTQLLARVNFPLYTVNVLTERHILVAGGGGQAKTGIRNVIEIYELINNGNTCRAESVTHYETGSQAIMNSITFHNGKYYVLAAGMEGMCQLYQMNFKMLDDEIGNNTKIKETETVEGKNNTNVQSSIRLRRRTNSSSASEGEKNEPLREKEDCENKEEPTQTKDHKRKKSDSNAGVIPVKIGFKVLAIQSFQTDFCKKDEPFQKIVRYSQQENILVTAGADGCLRIWNYPNLEMAHEIEAHQDDVDDLDISPLGQFVVSVSRDGHGYIWDVKSGKKVTELQFTLPSKSSDKYIFRSCRFGIVEGDYANAKLFTTLNPTCRSKPALPCYLCKWNTKSFILEKIISTGTDMLSVMSISDDGRFIGLGTQTGNVYIYIAFSLQKLYSAENAHSIFVTGLEFLKTSDETRRITGDKDTSLVSISVDNHINIHHIPKPATMGIFGILFIFVFALFLAYCFMDYMNL